MTYREREYESGMAEEMSAIDPKRFYGEIVERPRHDAAFEGAGKMLRRQLLVKEHRQMPSHILGPTQFWREFPRQAEALKTAATESTESDILCTFVNQGNAGYRKFVVAHPECYWWYYKDRPPEQQCSYEVIPESYPCRLYLDLEYLCELNPESSGPSMTNTLIEILCSYLLMQYGLPCNRSNIINLDSSTSEKFSRHLVFNVKDTAFRDNGHAGRLIKAVCNDILDYVLIRGHAREHKILCNFPAEDIENLMIQTKNGKKLFIDTGVYSRNRHFRIYKSTKWGKASHLRIADDCQYVPPYKSNDPELSLFLDSLISYFPNKKHLCLLEFLSDDSNDQMKSLSTQTTSTIKCGHGTQSESQYPSLDNYIRQLIYPGRIRACTRFEVSKTVIYETADYRYCENIGRCHKSNNVFLVVDLPRKVIYQKCHDPECFGFKSKAKLIPEEVYFEIADVDDDLLVATSLTEEIADQSDFFTD